MPPKVRSALAACLGACGTGRIAAGLLLAAAGGLLLVNRSLHARLSASPAAGGVSPFASAPFLAPSTLGGVWGHSPWAGSSRGSAAPRDPVHVCFCTDDLDLRGLAVAIRTALAHASDPSRLVFHVITSADAAPIFRTTLSAFIRGVPIDVRYDGQLQERLEAVIQFHRHTWTTWREEGLHSPFNFAPFFLPQFLEPGGLGGNHGGGGAGIQAKRLIYLDTDVVVLGDLIELHEMDLKGKAVATTRDCVWRYWDVFNKKWLRKRHFDPRSCVAQRGVLVIDVPRWKKKQLTESITGWMEFTRGTGTGLWLSPVAPSAWQLALNGSRVAKEIDSAWGCHNLGRDMMTLQEGKVLRHGGFDNKAFVDLEVYVDDARGNTTPFLATCTERAKLLHFNGPLKPWLFEAWRDLQPGPVCALPDSYRVPSPSWEKSASVWLRNKPFVRCLDLWTMHITQDLDCALKDIEREWAEDLRSWSNKYRISRKKKLALAEQEKQMEAERLEKERKKEEEQKQKEGQQPQAEGTGKPAEQTNPGGGGGR